MSPHPSHPLRFGVGGTELRWVGPDGQLYRLEGQLVQAGEGTDPRRFKVGEHFWYVDIHGDLRRIVGTQVSASGAAPVEARRFGFAAGRVYWRGPDGTLYRASVPAKRAFSFSVGLQEDEEVRKEAAVTDQRFVEEEGYTVGISFDPEITQPPDQEESFALSVGMQEDEEVRKEDADTDPITGFQAWHEPSPDQLVYDWIVQDSSGEIDIQNADNAGFDDGPGNTVRDVVTNHDVTQHPVQDPNYVYEPDGMEGNDVAWVRWKSSDATEWSDPIPVELQE